MLSQQNCVVIFIESDTLRYCVRKSGKLTSLIQGESLVEYQYQDLSDIEMLISDWQKTMPKNTTFKINIDITQIQMQSLTLPEISLTLNEVVLFVESSLYKLFQLSAKNIFFDFIHESAKTRKKSNVIVAICERDYIDKWIGLFAKYDLLLQFVGCIINEQQTINFLPWRQEQRRKHKFQLSMIAISYISLMICLFCYLFIQAQNTLETYTNQISKQQIVEQQLMRELSNRLPHSSPSQQQVYQFLLLLSMQLPSSIWLESFHYLPQKITIIGNSFTYPDITLFSHDLLTQIGIKNNQIQSVSIHNNFLLFEMDIELNVP